MQKVREFGRQMLLFIAIVALIPALAYGGAAGAMRLAQGAWGQDLAESNATLATSTDDALNGE